MKKKKSWKTTFFGTVAAVSGATAASPGTPDNVKGWAALVAAVAGSLMAFFARDNNVSSEDTGAK